MMPFFASFILISLWLRWVLKRQRRKQDEHEKNFWAKEAAANNTRRKSLEGLDYITIPFDFLPMHTMAEDEKVRECLETLETLSTLKIVNFTGYSNTDLKIEYGAPNITTLMEYDQNYTVLARTLQKWASVLLEHGYTQDAKAILEFAISTKTDVSKTYTDLSKIYREEGRPEKIESLLQIAEGLRSAMKPAIVRILKESDPCSG